MTRNNNSHQKTPTEKGESALDGLQKHKEALCDAPRCSPMRQSKRRRAPGTGRMRYAREPGGAPSQGEPTHDINMKTVHAFRVGASSTIGGHIDTLSWFSGESAWRMVRGSDGWLVFQTGEARVLQIVGALCPFVGVLLSKFAAWSSAQGFEAFRASKCSLDISGPELPKFVHVYFCSPFPPLKANRGLGFLQAPWSNEPCERPQVKHIARRFKNGCCPQRDMEARVGCREFWCITAGLLGPSGSSWGHVGLQQGLNHDAEWSWT